MTALGGINEKHYTGTSSLAHLSTDEGLLRWLQAELAVREPTPLDPISSRAINTLLYRQVGHHGRVEAANLRRVSDMIPDCDYGPAPHTVLYRGDMRQLVVDAIVNAAVPDLNGCPIPLHDCLDSTLHEQAGPWMRNDTNTVRRLNGDKGLEPADAIITRGYRLPAKYVIHTTGPELKNGKVTQKIAPHYLRRTGIVWSLPGLRVIFVRSHSQDYLPATAVSRLRKPHGSRWMRLSIGPTSTISL